MTSLINSLLPHISQNKHLKVLVCYGSQTGNVEAVSKSLFSRIVITYKTIKTMNEITDLKQLEEYDYVIFLVSTTGDGEFPDNAYSFWKLFRKWRDPLDFEYCIFGFGDSNYRSFAHTAKCLSRKLEKLAGEPFQKQAVIDDAFDSSEKLETALTETIDFIHNKKTEINNWFINKMTS